MRGWLSLLHYFHMADVPQQIKNNITSSYMPLILFGLGLFLVGIILVIPDLRTMVFHIAESGPIGAFTTGLLYTVGFTAPLATVMIANAAHVTPPWQLALIGGMGAMLYDLLIFAFIRRTTTQPFFEKLRQRFLGRRPVVWSLAAIGAIIIASPLPDELGSGLLGLSQLPQKYFLLLSFILNGIGIWVIAAIA